MSDAAVRRLLLFRVGTLVCAADLEVVREILPRLETTRIPGAMPFVAGLAGQRALYRGVAAMAETVPAERRCRRAGFLRRLTLSWAACYTAVAPVLIYRLWGALAQALA